MVGYAPPPSRETLLQICNNRRRKRGLEPLPFTEENLNKGDLSEERFTRNDKNELLFSTVELLNNNGITVVLWGEHATYYYGIPTAIFVMKLLSERKKLPRVEELLSFVRRLEPPDTPGFRNGFRPSGFDLICENSLWYETPPTKLDIVVHTDTFVGIDFDDQEQLLNIFPGFYVPSAKSLFSSFFKVMMKCQYSKWASLLLCWLGYIVGYHVFPMKRLLELPETTVQKLKDMKFLE